MSGIDPSQVKTLQRQRKLSEIANQNPIGMLLASKIVDLRLFAAKAVRHSLIADRVITVRKQTAIPYSDSD